MPATTRKLRLAGNSRDEQVERRRAVHVVLVVARCHRQFVLIGQQRAGHSMTPPDRLTSSKARSPSPGSSSTGRVASAKTTVSNPLRNASSAVSRTQ